MTTTILLMVSVLLAAGAGICARHARRLRQRLREMQRSAEEVGAELRSSEAAASQAQQENERLQVELRRAEGAVSQSQQENKDFQDAAGARRAEADAKADALRADLAEAGGRIRELEATLSAERGHFGERQSQMQAEAERLRGEAEELRAGAKAEMETLQAGAKAELESALAGLNASKGRIKELEAARQEDRDAFAAAAKRHREDLQAQRLDAEAKLDRLGAAREAAAVEAAGLRKEKESLEREHRRLGEASQQAQRQFEALAERIFNAMAEAYDAKSREGVGALLEPLKEQLESFRGMVGSAQAENVRANASLMAELEAVQRVAQQSIREVSSLTGALTNRPTEVGDWGEKTIEVLLDMAGLKGGCHYEKQKRIGYERSEDERPRTGIPDYIINLPEGKHIIIDSKTLFADYAKYAKADAAGDAEAKERHLAKHVGAIREAVRNLGKRHYQDSSDVDSPDFVLMYIPVEQAYIAAMTADADLYRDAFDRRVVPVTPTILLPILKIVAELWLRADHKAWARDLVEAAGRLVQALLESLKGLDGQLSSALAGIGEIRKSVGTGAETLEEAGRRFSTLQIDGGAAGAVPEPPSDPSLDPPPPET